MTKKIMDKKNGMKRKRGLKGMAVVVEEACEYDVK